MCGSLLCFCYGLSHFLLWLLLLVSKEHGIIGKSLFCCCYLFVFDIFTGVYHKQCTKLYITAQYPTKNGMLKRMVFNKKALASQNSTCYNKESILMLFQDTVSDMSHEI